MMVSVDTMITGYIVAAMRKLGYEEIRDDFLSSIEEMKQIHVVGVLRRGTRPRRRRRSDMKQIHIYMGDTSTLGNSLNSV
jgi:hypothetical protein